MAHEYRRQSGSSALNVELTNAPGVAVWTAGACLAISRRGGEGGGEDGSGSMRTFGAAGFASTVAGGRERAGARRGPGGAVALGGSVSASEVMPNRSLP